MYLIHPPKRFVPIDSNDGPSFRRVATNGEMLDNYEFINRRKQLTIRDVT